MILILCFFVWLIAAHAIADYPLQTDWIAAGKVRDNHNRREFGCPWYYILAAHAMIHGLAVGLIAMLFTQNIQYATALLLVEFVAHFFIDAAKNENMFRIHADQAFHVACKLLLAFTLGVAYASA